MPWILIVSDPGLEISKIYQAGFGCVNKQSKYGPVGDATFVAAANEEFIPVQNGVALRHDGPCAIRHEEDINNNRNKVNFLIIN